MLKGDDRLGGSILPSMRTKPRKSRRSISVSSDLNDAFVSAILLDSLLTKNLAVSVCLLYHTAQSYSIRHQQMECCLLESHLLPTRVAWVQEPASFPGFPLSFLSSYNSLHLILVILDMVIDLYH